MMLKERKGFTLVELLIGIILISIIGAAALKTFGIIGSSAQNIGEQERKTITAQGAADMLYHIVPSSGMVGNTHNIFIGCNGGSTCDNKNFAIRRSGISGVIVDAANDVIIPSESTGCNNLTGTMFVYDLDGNYKGYGTLSSSTPPSAYSTAPWDNVDACDISTSFTEAGGLTLDDNDMFDINIEFFQYIIDATDNTLKMRRYINIADPTVTSFPSADSAACSADANCEEYILMEDILASHANTKIEYVVFNSSGTPISPMPSTYDASDTTQLVKSAKISLQINSIITKTIFVGARGFKSF